MKAINKYQFGKSKAGECLSAELNRLADSKHIKVCGRIITELKEDLSVIDTIKNKRQKYLFYRLIRNYNLKLISDSVILKDQAIKNFLNNVVVAILRSYVKNKL